MYKQEVITLTFNMDWVEEFYQKFTDGCDKENEYYDSQFTVNKPREVEYFIHELLKKENKQNNMDNNKPDPVFADGFIFKRPREGAPEFVKGALSLKVDEAIAFLQKHNNAGWVNLDLNNSQGGKLYLQLNDWKPPTQDTAQPPVAAPVEPVAAANPQDAQDAPAIVEGDIPW